MTSTSTPSPKRRPRSLPKDAELWIEPGRSLVAQSAVTLYRVVTVKRGSPTFVAVDGGIADNMEASTYVGTRFDAVLADRPTGGGTPVELVGRQCESGDLFASDLPLADPQVGDVVALPITGAYTYTLLSNYNGALRPPVVFVRERSRRNSSYVERPTTSSPPATCCSALTAARSTCS